MPSNGHSCPLAQLTSEIELLQAEVDENDESYFRFLMKKTNIKYITIAAGIFSDDHMSFAPTLIPSLPPLPPGDWNEARIEKHEHSGLPYISQAARVVLPKVEHLWHPTKIEYLAITCIQRWHGGLFEAAHHAFACKAIAKFARFDFEVGYIDSESEAYQWVNGTGICPRFLGHILEEGRAMGFLLEKIEHARHAESEDLQRCQTALAKLHNLGIKHGDTNKHNFLIIEDRTYIIDLDSARKCHNRAELQEEMDGLAEQLLETSGRGGILAMDPGEKEHI